MFLLQLFFLLRENTLCPDVSKSSIEISDQTIELSQKKILEQSNARSIEFDRVRLTR